MVPYSSILSRMLRFGYELSGLVIYVPLWSSMVFDILNSPIALLCPEGIKFSPILKALHSCFDTKKASSTDKNYFLKCLPSNTKVSHLRAYICVMLKIFVEGNDHTDTLRKKIIIK